MENKKTEDCYFFLNGYCSKVPPTHAEIEDRRIMILNITINSRATDANSGIERG